MTVQSQLRDAIVKHFNRDELERFCADYFPEAYQEYEGTSIPLSRFAQELVEYCERRDLLIRLMVLVKQSRPRAFSELNLPANVTAQVEAFAQQEPGLGSDSIATNEQVQKKGRDRRNRPVQIAVAGAFFLLCLVVLLKLLPTVQVTTSPNGANQRELATATNMATPFGINSRPTAICISPMPPPSRSELKAMVLITGTRHLRSDQGDYIEIDAFLMNRYEITNIQYRDFVLGTSHAAPPNWQGTDYSVEEAYWPVTQVTWSDAKSYCEWEGGRLPNQWEWELACQGSDGRAYPWSSDWLTCRANTVEAGRQSTQNVGAYRSSDGSSLSGDSPYGISDLSGNVAEWTSSLYEDNAHIIRGGAWFSAAEDAQCRSWLAARPDEGPLPGVGFRCVRNVP